MRLHPEKSSHVCLTRGGQGFDFLGFHHRKMESWKWRGRHYLQRWPSARAMRVLRDKIRAATARSEPSGRYPPWSPTSTPSCGVGGVLRNGNSGRKFNAVDGYVHDGWRSSPAANTDAGQELEHPYPAVADRLGVYRLTGNVHWATAQPAGERCRKAGCGRTACTV